MIVKAASIEQIAHWSFSLSPDGVVERWEDERNLTWTGRPGDYKADTTGMFFDPEEDCWFRELG